MFWNDMRMSKMTKFSFLNTNVVPIATMTWILTACMRWDLAQAGVREQTKPGCVFGGACGCLFSDGIVN